MGYEGQGIGQINQGILIPIVDEPRFKHEGLGYDGRNKNTMDTKTIFVKEKDKLELTCPLGGNNNEGKGNHTSTQSFLWYIAS